MDKKTAFLLLTLLTFLVIVSYMDTQAEDIEQRQYCEMVKLKLWPKDPSRHCF
jgi:hypothetical protein